MTRETIPKKSMVIGQTVTANVMKYCLDHGEEKGIRSDRSIIMIVDGKRMMCGEALCILVTRDTEITLVQE
jgi:hypothetical protein